MRCAAIACVLALLLPTVSTTGGRSGDDPPAPLDFFDPDPAAWTPSALVVEVYYNALRADEFVVVANLAATPLDLTGWTLTDREGVLMFPGGSVVTPGARVTVAQNSTRFYEDTLRAADFRYAGGNGTAMIVTGTFQLNNGGDEVILRDGTDATVDVLAYGASTYALEGWTGPPARTVGTGNVAHRDPDPSRQDTNSSADWDLVRVWSLGQSVFAPASFSFTGRVWGFVTPDAQTYALRELLDSATASIDLSLYTFTNSELGNAIASAVARGVRVRILLEGAPVGGIDRDEWTLVTRLVPAGVAVHFMVDNTTLDIQERYRYLHAKYAVLDGSIVFVSTENWGASAFPTWNATGSRGWAVAVEHAPLAAYFTAVFEEDFDARRRDVHTLSEMTVIPVAPTPDPVGPRGPSFPWWMTTADVRVVPVLGPDTSLAAETIIGVLRNATETIHGEIFYAYTDWGPFPNLYVEELLAAARRGVSVRILLDASPYNIEDDDPIDNDNTVATLNTIAADEGLDLQAKLIDLPAHGLARMHTKGFVVDGRWLLVSSINWNRNSPTGNREAGLLIEGTPVAAFFDTVFAWDWTDNFVPPVADAGPDRAPRAGTPVTFNGLGSSDDEEVVNWSWDFESDGRWDAWGPEVTHVYPDRGTFTVRLCVADLWNNTAEDVATITVLSALSAPPPSWLWVWPLAGAAVAIALWFAFARRNRQRINKRP